MVTKPQAAEDARWMQEALAEARKGEGCTRPNPPVGAVVVKGRREVGRGYHRKAGGPHAEVHALRAAGEAARGATIYITLEPCSTTGRTPPCTRALLDAGVRRVVVGVKDANPDHAGRGLQDLRRKGLKVVSGVEEAACRELVAPFFHWVRHSRPLLTLKLGMTLDGRIADAQGKSKWITGAAARKEVQALRRQSDAILVGGETQRLDDPSLLPRPARGRKPWRCVLDPELKISLQAKLLCDGHADQTIIFTSSRAAATKIRRVEQTGARVVKIPLRGKRLDLRRVLDHLGSLGVMQLLCEGGGQLAGSLVLADRVDRYRIFMAPSLLGDAARPAVAGLPARLDAIPPLIYDAVDRVGDDIMISARPRRP